MFVETKQKKTPVHVDAHPENDGKAPLHLGPFDLQRCRDGGTHERFEVLQVGGNIFPFFFFLIIQHSGSPTSQPQRSIEFW